MSIRDIVNRLFARGDDADAADAPPPPVIMTQWGPVTEAARKRAALNMKADPAKRRAVEELLCKQLGSVARGLAEARRRYPEVYEDDKNEEAAS